MPFTCTSSWILSDPTRRGGPSTTICLSPFRSTLATVGISAYCEVIEQRKCLKRLHRSPDTRASRGVDAEASLNLVECLRQPGDEVVIHPLGEPVAFLVRDHLGERVLRTCAANLCLDCRALGRRQLDGDIRDHHLRRAPGAPRPRRVVCWSSRRTRQGDSDDAECDAAAHGSLLRHLPDEDRARR